MKRWLLLLVIVAIAVRLAAALIHPFIFPDSLDYDALARAILAGRPYAAGGGIASRMPGYPLFLAVIYAQTGGALKAALAVQAVIGGATVWMTYLLARRAGETVGLLAAALVAVDPLSVAFSASLLSETPFTLLLLVGVWICFRLLERPRFWNWLVLGVMWGGAVYLRAEALWCVVPLGLVVCFARQKMRGVAGAVAGIFVAVAIVFLCLMPWQMRNFRAFHTGYFRLTTLEGISLYESVYSGANGGPRQDAIVLPPAMRPLNEAARSDEWERRAWSDVAADPGRIALLAIRKMARTWSPFFNAGDFQRPAVQALMGLWQIPLFVLALVGLFCAPMPRSMRWLLLMPLFYFTAMHALFLGSVRYRVPLMPLVCIFAATGLVYVGRRITGGKSASARAGSAGAMTM